VAFAIAYANAVFVSIAADICLAVPAFMFSLKQITHSVKVFIESVAIYRPCSCRPPASRAPPPAFSLL
jgi:hypothetical protein